MTNSTVTTQRFLQSARKEPRPSKLFFASVSASIFAFCALNVEAAASNAGVEADQAAAHREVPPEKANTVDSGTAIEEAPPVMLTTHVGMGTVPSKPQAPPNATNRPEASIAALKRLAANQISQNAQDQKTVPPSALAEAEKYGLSPDAYALAVKWDFIQFLNRFEKLRAIPPESRTTNDRFEMLEVKHALSDKVMRFLIDVRRTLNKIDRESASTQEVQATLMERRDRAIRFNTYADMVAGGFTGILSGALKLGNLPITPEVVDVAEGVVQAGLSGWALSNEIGQHKFIQGVPSILANLIIQGNSNTPEYPKSVWEFLESVPINSKDGLTRRASLVKRWTDKEFCLVHGGHMRKKADRIHHIAGTHDRPQISIDVLEDRVAMLMDLRATVTMMDEILGEFAELSYGF